MCRGDRLGDRHCAQDPTFLGARGLRLPGYSFSFKSPPNQLAESPHNNVSGILIESPCALVDFISIPVYALLY